MVNLKAGGELTWSRAAAASCLPCVSYSLIIDQGKANVCSALALCISVETISEESVSDFKP